MVSFLLLIKMLLPLNRLLKLTFVWQIWRSHLPPYNYTYKASDKRRPFTCLNGFAVQPHNQIPEIELAESLCQPCGFSFQMLSTQGHLDQSISVCLLAQRKLAIRKERLTAGSANTISPSLRAVVSMCRGRHLPPPLPHH